jgi:hypothetical protein
MSKLLGPDCWTVLPGCELPGKEGACSSVGTTIMAREENDETCRDSKDGINTMGRLCAEWLERGGARERGVMMGMEGSKYLILWGLAVAWAGARVGDCQKA